MAFNRDEADAALLGLRFVLARGDDELANTADTALLKIAEGMGDEAEVKMHDSGLTVAPCRQRSARPARDDQAGHARSSEISDRLPGEGGHPA
jgi:hypothetical protein